MIRLTDMTLAVLDTTKCKTETLVEFYELLLLMGVDRVEMNLTEAQRLGSALVKERTVVRMDNPFQNMEGFSRLLCHEMEVNDICDLSLLERYKHHENIRITGLGDLMLYDFQSEFQMLRRLLPMSVELCPDNGYGCAGAILTEWLMGGGNGAGTFIGVGGFAPLEEVIMALHVAGQHRPGLDLSMLPRMCHLFTEISGIKVQSHKSIVGHAVFEVESGIHVDGILKNPMNYEPFSPDLVGADRRIVIGKHSGMVSLKHCLSILGFELPAEAVPLMLNEVRREAVNLRRALADSEVLLIAEKVRVDYETESISNGYHAS